MTNFDKKITLKDYYITTKINVIFREGTDLRYCPNPKIAVVLTVVVITNSIRRLRDKT